MVVLFLDAVDVSKARTAGFSLQGRAETPVKRGAVDLVKLEHRIDVGGI
jgi:hypothetical protein